MRGRLPDSRSVSQLPVAASSAALLAAVLTASMASPPVQKNQMSNLLWVPSTCFYTLKLKLQFLFARSAQYSNASPPT